MCAGSAQVSQRSHKSCVFEATLRGVWKLLLVSIAQSFWKQLYNHKKQRKPESKVEQVSVQAPVHRTIAFCAYVWVFKWVTEKHLVCVLGNKKNKKSYSASFHPKPSIKSMKWTWWLYSSADVHGGIWNELHTTELNYASHAMTFLHSYWPQCQPKRDGMVKLWWNVPDVLDQFKLGWGCRLEPRAEEERAANNMLEFHVAFWVKTFGFHSDLKANNM